MELLQISKAEEKVMEYCPQCGNELNENPNFCPKCGKKLSVEKKSIDSHDDVLFDPNKLLSNDKSKCIRCNIVFETGYYEIEERHCSAVTKYGVGNHICDKCFDELSGRPTKFTHPFPGEIKCPFCGQFFDPPRNLWSGGIKTQKTTNTGGNILRGAVFLPWGVVSAAKNIPFIKCPHCGMKIMQG